MFIWWTDSHPLSEDDEIYDDAYDDAMSAYYKALIESDGFGVPFSPKHVDGMIGPLTLEAEGAREAMEPYANLGIDRYNKEKGTSLELVDLVKVMQELVGPFTFYITFTAKETGSDQIRTYQTKVVDRCPSTKTYVEFTRVKPEHGRRMGRGKGKGKKKGKKEEEEEKEGNQCSCCHS